MTLRNGVSGHSIGTFPAMNPYAGDGSPLEFGVNMSRATRYPSLCTWRFAGLRQFASSASIRIAVIRALCK